MDDEERRKCVMLSRDQMAPKMPEDQLILSEVAVYTGGRDLDGRPIISFPSRHHASLESKVKASGLDHILRYFAELASPRDRAHGMAFVADLRFSSVEFVSLLKSALNSLQAEMQAAGGKSVFYAIQPQNKKTMKDTMTILGLRVSKKKKNKMLASPIFQTLLLADGTDLHNYVDQSQLLTDLGGYLQYSHLAWVKFRKTVEPFFVSFHECSTKYSSALDRLTNLEEVQLGASQTELEETLQKTKRCYEEAVIECNLPSTCVKCTDLLQKLKHSEDDPIFNEVAQKAVFRDTYNHVKDCMASLNEMKSRMDHVWKTAESKINLLLSAMEYSAQLKQLIKWFTKDSKKLLREREIGDTPGRAEALKNHFEAAELPLAEEKIANAEQLVEKIQAMVVTSPQQGALDVKNQARRLLKILKEFRKRLDEKEDFVIAVCDYYTLCDEIERWCNKVLRFLPPNLDKIHDFLSSSHLSRRSAILVEWRESLRKFMMRRPPPDDEEIINLEQSVKLIGDEVIKRRSLELIDRYDLLMSVLSAKRPALRSDVQQALRWRYDFLEENDFQDSDLLSHSGSYVENRSASGREDKSEIVDPLVQRLMAPETFDPRYYQQEEDETNVSHGGDLHDGNGFDGGMNSQGSSTHRSIHDDKCSISSRSQSSTVGRISGRDYYSGNIPPADQMFTPNGGQRSNRGYSHGQPLHGGHPQQSLSRQNLMLSASQPHLPINTHPYVHPYTEVEHRYSPYIMKDQIYHAGNGALYYPSMNRFRNHTESYIPMLSDIEGGNSSGAEVKGQADATHYVTAYDTVGNHSQFYSSAVQSNSYSSVHTPVSPDQAMHIHNSINNRDGSYVASQNAAGLDLSPGQVPEFGLRADQFHTSTPRGNNSDFGTHHQRHNPGLPTNQYSSVSPTNQAVSHGSHGQRQRSPYDDVINGIHHIKVKGNHHHQPAPLAKSTPDLRRLSAMEINFDLDPELVASELDSDEQVEYYKRVCGFLKSLPTKKRKPRRLRNRQGKSKETGESLDAEGKPLGNVDKISEYSRSTGSLFDTSLNEDVSYESHGFAESPHVKLPVGSRPTSQQQDRAETLTRENILANGKEEKGSGPILDRPPTGLNRTLSPSRRRNLIPDGTPPIAPMTDSLRRFLEDTEQERDSPGKGEQSRDEEIILEVVDDDDDDDDEDLRRYEELLSQREEDLEGMHLPGDTDDEEEDLMEHEAFLNQVSSIERQQDRTRHEADQIAAQNNIRIGQADELLRKLSQDDHHEDGPPSLHLSDEGAILDGMSIEDIGEHGSSIATERESVESGVGMQFKRERSLVGRYQANV